MRFHIRGGMTFQGNLIEGYLALFAALSKAYAAFCLPCAYHSCTSMYDSSSTIFSRKQPWCLCHWASMLQRFQPQPIALPLVKAVVAAYGQRSYCLLKIINPVHPRLKSCCQPADLRKSSAMATALPTYRLHCMRPSRTTQAHALR